MRAILALLISAQMVFGALSFGDGSSNRILINPNASGMNNQTSYTVLMWTRVTSFTANRAFFRKDTDPISNNLKNLRTLNTNAISNTTGCSTTNAAATSANNAISLNTWHFLVSTFDGTTPKLYVGSLTATVAEVSYASQQVCVGTINNDGDRIAIGNSPNATPNGGCGCSIATFQYIGGRAASLAEIQSLQFRPRVVSGTLMFMIPGLNGTGTQPDLSGNGNNGTVSGATVVDHVPLSAPFATLWDWFKARLFPRGVDLSLAA